MPKGYVYALINPSIPDAVKVGKTERSPDKRADELSAGTGVATKFIVAYSQFFNDCSSAEDFVHTALETQGYRISENREFFSAPLHVVVKAISDAPGKASEGITGGETEDDDDGLLSLEGEGDIDSLTLDNYKPKEPWDDIYSQAKEYRDGAGEVLQDFREALKLFKQAAKLGSKEAFLDIGEMYYEGEGVREDDSKALDYWKAGAKRGNWMCFGSMSVLFFQHWHEANARKCLDKLLSGFLDNIRELSINPTEVIIYLGKMMVISNLAVNLDIALPELEKLSSVKEIIKQVFLDDLKKAREYTEAGFISNDDYEKHSDLQVKLIEWVETVT